MGKLLYIKIVISDILSHCSTMAVSNISLATIQGNTLDLFDTTVVNVENSAHAELVTALIVLIPIVNIPIIRSVYKDNSGTFINKLILLDCANALAHVPIVIRQYR